MIKYSIIKRKQLSLPELADMFQKEVDQSAFFKVDLHSIAFECLKKVNFKNLKNEKKSVEKYCKMILQLSTPFRTFLETPVESFLLLFLNIKTSPVEHKNYLETKAKNDFLIVEELLNHYQSIPFLKKYIHEPLQAKNHYDRTVLVFYKRALAKKKEILDYLMYKVNTRAIEKAKPKAELVELKLNDYVKETMEIHLDFPYLDPGVVNNKFGYKIDLEHIDYREINPIKNKRNVYRFKSDTSKGITKQIEKEISTHFNAKKYLDLVYKKIKDLPIVNERLDIFRELRKLYLAKKWYGFYALALPQVEGIFSEMVNIVYPNKNSTGSLTDKVQVIRPFYEYSKYSFDYYEFYLPNQRNRFSHTGKDENIKVKCSFILLDLVHIINVFEELNSPLIEVSNILKEGVTYFNDIGKFSRFLYLLNKLKATDQLMILKPKIDDFIYTKLISHIDFVSFLKNLQTDFSLAKTEFEYHLNLFFQWHSKKEISFFSLLNEDIIKHIKEIETILLGNLKIMFEEDLKLLLDTNFFIRTFTKVFDKIPMNITQQLNNFENLNKKIFEKLNILNAKAKLDVPEDFLLKKNKWQHSFI